ncbi:MAG: glycosyltransferase [Ignavibacteria bacterium]|nr:MAG: glycosyltransferase [Chlorobiota bacterium]MBV6399469.1 hypothetical protein [Ignavibacteria bacterium]MCC6886687.1 glycosyltransferase [Ignavibacteriales bacterium]MCE7953174.1 glycosyltransferase [Chlorobi bacterium CHB7]RIK50045.1 MAG: Chondroitin polymerase [Ignavibacteriota bacterium]
MTKTTVIVSVYDKIPELELVIHALLYQTDKNFSVIIAEDGNSENMKAFCSMIKKFPIEISHVTQTDQGFRKNSILNKAIGNVSSGQIIFIDGDCVPHSRFIEAHRSMFQPDTVLCGRRVALGKRESLNITIESIINKEYERTGLRQFIDSLSSNPDSSKHVEEGLFIESKILKYRKRGTIRLLGCNFSLSRELLIKVNGFDENYTSPGIGEDTDLEFRLRLAGANFESVRNKAIVYHLWHTKTKENPENLSYFQSIMQRSEYKCKNGLVKLN